MDVDISYFFYNIQCYLANNQNCLDWFNFMVFLGLSSMYYVSGTYITIHLHTLYTYYYKHLRNSYLGDTDGL